MFIGHLVGANVIYSVCSVEKSDNETQKTETPGCAMSRTIKLQCTSFIIWNYQNEHILWKAIIAFFHAPVRLTTTKERSGAAIPVESIYTSMS